MARPFPFSMSRAAAVVIFAVIVVLFSAVALAGADRPHLSSDPLVNSARTLIENGHFDEALSILRPLAPNHPDRTDVLFLLGLAAMRASEQAGIGKAAKTALLNESITAFHTILIRQPGLVRVRLELAQAFFLKGEDGLSRQQFERVLAGRPPAAMVTNIQRFLTAIRARRRWSGQFGFTLAPDDNLNAASDSNIFYYNGFPLRRDTDADAKSGVGFIMWGGGEYQHPLDERLRLHAGANIVQREFPGIAFDQTTLAVHIGPRWLADDTTELSLFGSARLGWVAGETNYREHGVRLEAERHLTQRLTARANSSWHRRKYSRNNLLDGPRFAFSLGGSWFMTPTVRTDATVGYTYERPKSLIWRNSSRWARFGISMLLPFGFTLGINGEQHWTNYQGRWLQFTPGGVSRRDRTRVVKVSVLNRSFIVHGFSPELVLVNEARKTNAQLYDYRRNRAELRFVRQL